MTAPHTEADARILIDEMLRRAGWDPANKADVLTEVPVVLDLVEEAVSAAAFDPAPKRADSVLLDQQGRPLAVFEAKKKAIDPYTAKTQTLPYAEKLDAPFIFLSNGEQIYFWDYGFADARPVASFFSRRDLARLRDLRRHRLALVAVPIPEFYQSHGETFRFRDYQSACLRAIDRTIELGKRRFLAELPTGTGKTDVICQQIKRLIEAGQVERVLFLVDRDDLDGYLGVFGSVGEARPHILFFSFVILVLPLELTVASEEEGAAGGVAELCHFVSDRGSLRAVGRGIGFAVRAPIASLVGSEGGRVSAGSISAARSRRKSGSGWA
jgi:hypothetical protein